MWNMASERNETGNIPEEVRSQPHERQLEVAVGVFLELQSGDEVDELEDHVRQR